MHKYKQGLNKLQINNMSKLKWITPKSLGIVEEKKYFRLQLTATGDSTEISYSHVSGILPDGVTLSDIGLLCGVPNTVKPNQQPFDTVVDFTVRARDNYGKIADKTFNFTVSSVTDIGIDPDSEFLGTFLDGDRLEHQINLKFFDQTRPVDWRIVSGQVPEGIKLNQNGLIYGFLGNKKTNQNLDQYGWDNAPWDLYFLDATTPQNSSFYEFVVEVNDGIYQNRKSYKIQVLPRDYVVRADRTYPIDYDSKLEASQNGHLPIIIEESTTLPQITTTLSRHNTNFAFKFNARDLDGDEVYYEITSPDKGGFDQDSEVGFDQSMFDSSNYPMPRGIGVNNQSGWYTGHFAKQNQIKTKHTFQLYGRKLWGRDYSGPKTNFTVEVLGDFDSEIYWITPSNLGTIDNGSFSSIRIHAVNSNNLALTYKIKTSVRSKTPQGLVLLPTGELSGRVSFRYFSLDNTKLTLDGDKTTFDRKHEFTVSTYDRYNKFYSEKTFTLTLNVLHKSPYDILYLRAMPNKIQRKFLKSIIENKYYFPDSLIYRASDPWWGKKSYLEFLFLTGLEPGDLDTYLPAIAKNHFTKTFSFGEIKTAYALDNDYNIVYEVVYLEVIDSQLGIDSNTGLQKYPQQAIPLSKPRNFYSVNGVEQKTLYPNGLGNMNKQVSDNVSKTQLAKLPLWMTSMQPNPNSISGFEPPIGYKPAVVLAYTEPGASKTIEYRLKNANLMFNNIEFTTDRYLLDNILSKQYDITTKQFIPGKECYVDQQPSVAEYHRTVSDVDWAIESSYSKISGQLTSNLIADKLFDGKTAFANGDTVVFVQLGDYVSIDDYSIGWVDSKTEKAIPGYINHILTGVDNERTAIYQISIVNDQTFLNLLNLSKAGDIVKIKHGEKYGGKTLCLDAFLVRGVDPTWREAKSGLAVDPKTNLEMNRLRTTTTFDSNATRFIDHRDQYYSDPNSEDKYIKFPKTGVFI